MRALLLVFSALLSSCGLLLQYSDVTPPSQVLLSENGAGFKLTLPFDTDGRGGNVHDPMSVSKYHNHDCDQIYTNTVSGRVDAKDIRLFGASGPFRGFIQFEHDQVIIQFDVTQYLDNSKTEWRPYRFNGSYRMSPVDADGARLEC